jgi:hypothetical protein
MKQWKHRMEAEHRSSLGWAGLGYHAEEVAGVQVAGRRAPPEELVRRLRPPARALRDGSRRRSRQHSRVSQQRPEPPAPVMNTHANTDDLKTHPEEKRGSQVTNVSAGAARSEGRAAPAASSASTAITRSSGSRSNGSSTPCWPAANGSPTVPEPPLLRLALGEPLLVGFLMAPGHEIVHQYAEGFIYARFWGILH